MTYHGAIDPSRDTVFLPLGKIAPGDLGSSGMGLFRLQEALRRLRADPSGGVSEPSEMRPARVWNMGDETVRIAEIDHGAPIELVVSVSSDRDDDFRIGLLDVMPMGRDAPSEHLVAHAIVACGYAQRALAALSIEDPADAARAEHAFIVAEGAAWRQLDVTATPELAKTVSGFLVNAGTPWSKTTVECRDHAGNTVGILRQHHPILSSLKHGPAIVVAQPLQSRIELIPTSRVRESDPMGRLRADLAYARFLEEHPGGDS